MEKKLILILFVAAFAAAKSTSFSSDESPTNDKVFNYVGEQRDSQELADTKQRENDVDMGNDDLDNDNEDDELREPFPAEVPDTIENDSEGSQDRVEQEIQDFLRQDNNQENVDYLIEDNRFGQKPSNDDKETKFGEPDFDGKQSILENEESVNQNIQVVIEDVKPNPDIKQTNPDNQYEKQEAEFKTDISSNDDQLENNNFETNIEDNMIENMHINSVEGDHYDDTGKNTIDDNVAEQVGEYDSVISNIGNNQDNTNKDNVEESNPAANKYNEEIDKSYEENISAALDDLKEDLDEIFKTVDELGSNGDTENNEKLPENVNEDNEDVKHDDVAEYEEVNERPYNEKSVLQQREYNDLAMEDIDPEDNKDYELAAEYYDYEPDENAKPYVNDEMNSENKLDEGNDQLSSIVEPIAKTDEESDTNKLEQQPQALEPQHKAVEDLTSREVNDLMVEFAITHAEELDQLEDNFDKNIAPVLITLSVDEATVITSPDYPSAYPRNNIVDWVLDGRGRGIELNVTDFSVDGYLGDYLLVQPGGIDDSEHDGLIFSYHLRSERHFRFLDVNRMFIRFESKPGQSEASGFRLSVKLISPLPIEETPEPEPEAVADPPEHTLLVFLGGLSPLEFRSVEEDFRLVVADMATLYINTNGLDAGETNTTQATQITQVSVCNVNWPSFNTCVGVRFGVSVTTGGLTGPQLGDMWSTYVDQDPFAARLERLGVEEFSAPATRGSLAQWTLAAAAAAAAAAALALALWRWGCGDDYTKMSQYRSSSSLGGEKRRADLFPPPHQPLPPLYDDDFVKYDQYADEGGVGNGGYARADDSDDELAGAVDTPERYTTDV